MQPQPSEIEVVWLTPWDLFVAYLAGLVLAGLAMVGAVWATRGPRPTEPEQDDRDDPDATVEISPPVARRRRPPNTGTVHEPRRPAVPADDATVVVRHPDEVPR